MNADDLIRHGYQSVMTVALGLRGDLARILGHTPTIPAGLDGARQRSWSTGVVMARIDLADLLLPDGELLESWLSDHNPDAADAQAVLAFAEGGSISQVRAGLFGEG